MKNICALLAFVLLASFNTTFTTARAQGALTPPGAPAPTMHTLDQIYGRTDARIPITNSDSTVSISAPGSYYLTSDLTVGSSEDGIDIFTNGVTLDLNGYTISSTTANAAGMGIKFFSGLSDVTIGNGHIQGGVTNNGSGVYGGSGFKNGIYYSGTAPVNVLVSRVTVSGCLLNGIYLNTLNSTEVESCTVRTIGGYGILASLVKQSSAIDCGNNAITGDQVSDCFGESTGSGAGVYANSSALNCYGSSVSDDGVSTSTSALNCFGLSDSGDGISTSLAENCNGSSTIGTGISSVFTALNCLGLSSSGDGIDTYNAENCYGTCSSGGGDGIHAYSTAQASYGASYSGTGLDAFIASVCHGGTISGTATNITHNVNSF